MPGSGSRRCRAGVRDLAGAGPAAARHPEGLDAQGRQGPRSRDSVPRGHVNMPAMMKRRATVAGSYLGSMHREDRRFGTGTGQLTGDGLSCGRSGDAGRSKKAGSTNRDRACVQKKIHRA
ncbi:hypothetical protein SEVIR_1G174233v4 [Setaria viridis]